MHSINVCWYSIIVAYVFDFHFLSHHKNNLMEISPPSGLTPSRFIHHPNNLNWYWYQFYYKLFIDKRYTKLNLIALVASSFVFIRQSILRLIGFSIYFCWWQQCQLISSEETKTYKLNWLLFVSILFMGVLVVKLFAVGWRRSKIFTAIRHDCVKTNIGVLVT